MKGQQAAEGLGQELDAFGIARTLDDLQPEPFVRGGAGGHIASTPPTSAPP